MALPLIFRRYSILQCKQVKMGDIFFVRQTKLIKQRLVAVFLIGMLLLFSPLITLPDRPQLLFGLPILYLYLFGVWMLLIAAMAWVVRGHDE